MVSRRRFVCGVFGPFALARRFSVPVVRPRSGVANLDPALEVLSSGRKTSVTAGTLVSNSRSGRTVARRSLCNYAHAVS